MTVYVFRDGQYVNKRTGEPMLSEGERARPIAAPMVVSDLPAYRSPLGDGVVDGRSARREHFKRTNTREVDPSEWKQRSENFQSSKAEKQAIADNWRAGTDIKRGTA
jgi:hypothetical protein